MESALRAGGRDPQLRLIETLRTERGVPQAASLHLARMAASATALGWSFDTDAAMALLTAPSEIEAERLRLTLDRAGRFDLTRAPAPAPRGLVHFTIASERLDSADPWLRHKTSNRALYDRTHAALPEGVGDSLFLNERGEICEGCISNVFFDTGDGICTPPLTSGLLPGILRQQILADGGREEILRPEDLSLARHPGLRLWLGNALRGLTPAIPV